MTDMCECEQERAAILEHDARMDREIAERTVLDMRPYLDGMRCAECPRDVEESRP
jgi:hypothetical protein